MPMTQEQMNERTKLLADFGKQIFGVSCTMAQLMGLMPGDMPNAHVIAIIEALIYVKGLNPKMADEMAITVVSSLCASLAMNGFPVEATTPKIKPGTFGINGPGNEQSGQA